MLILIGSGLGYPSSRPKLFAGYIVLILEEGMNQKKNFPPPMGKK